MCDAGGELAVLRHLRVIDCDHIDTVLEYEA